jgi:hypothetical protein
MFSSVVIYSVQPSVNYNFWFWQGSQAQTILGVRYYTEKQDIGANTYTAYTASFEKTLSTLTTSGGTYITTVQGVFAGSQYDALAESVLRQQITYVLKTGSPYNTADITQPAVKITNMQARVVNITGRKDFYITQLNTDVAQLSNWATSTIYIPTGNATEIIATNNADFAFSRTGLTNPATQPLAVQTVDVSGLGPLATVYTSIINRTATASPSAGAVLPASNIITTANEEWVFGGANITGTRLPHIAAYDLTTKGTVEAWVYINVMTDTAGFVHKGVLADFTDECYTLQGWGNGGQIAFCIDSLGGNYDIATSDINLNTKKWYYLVGTWDTTAATPYINLYINGVLHGSTRPYNTAASGAQVNNSDILIGSQLPVSYNTTWGYFGLNGKIVGANISGTPMTAATALANYNQYSAATANW